MSHDTTTRAGTAPSAARNRTLTAYGLGALATAGALAYALIDQLALGGLDRHLHALYDPVGKYGEAAPLYGYLYLVGVLGLGCWWFNARLVRRGARSAKPWGWITFAVAALPVLAPVVIQEYGQPVIPLGLSAGFVVAWVCGLVGGLVLRRGQA